MRSLPLAVLVLVSASVFFSPPAFADSETTKRDILHLARSYQGQGDPDRSKQRRLEKLVRRLLRENPQPPLRHRLPLVYGAWKQVWGPYDYRNDKRGVDPALDSKNIIQVVFEGGYYYNVNPTLNKKGEVKATTLLRGDYVLSPEGDDVFEVRFTNLRRIKGPPPSVPRLQDLAALCEAGELPGQYDVLPGFFVRLFFGGGRLEEVYTDEDMRITFGSGRDGGPNRYIFVFTRLPLDPQ